jgi:hypothetical protein
MKNDANEKNPLAKWVMRLTTAGLAIGVLFLWQQYQAAAAAKNLDRETVLANKMLETANANHLLHLLGTGQTDAAKQELSLQLASRVSELQSLLPEVGESIQITGWNLCEIVIRAEKSHPEQYLAGSPVAQMAEMNEWKALDGDRFSTQFAMSLKKDFKRGQNN